MRMLILPVVFVFLATPGFSQFIIDPFSLNAAELAANKKARVHFVHKYFGPEEWQDPAEEQDFIAEVEYSESGFPIQYLEREEYWDEDEDWDTVFTVSYLFSGPGNSLSRVNSVDADGYEVNSLYTYDKKGKLLMKEVADIDPPTYEYTYDKGRIVSCRISQKFPEYDEDGNFTGKALSLHTYQSAYSYDQNGRLSAQTQYQAMGGELAFSQRLAYEYDGQGRLSKFLSYQDEVGGEPGTEVVYYYDERGLLTKMTEADLYMDIFMTYEYRYTYYE